VLLVSGQHSVSKEKNIGKRKKFFGHDIHQKVGIQGTASALVRRSFGSLYFPATKSINHMGTKITRVLEAIIFNKTQMGKRNLERNLQRFHDCVRSKIR
jgi:hypothetical protein